MRTALAIAASALLLVACEPTNQGYAPTQPIAYSHAVHAGALQIDCQYCHFAAERGRYAGIPPAKICMNCHKTVVPEHPEIQKVRASVEAGKPIPWVRVNHIPDHATFNHSPHVAAKVACQTCHGPVESMGRVEQWAPLTMGWCLDCHRNPPNAGKPGAAVPGQGNRLTDCAVCHH